MGHDDGFTVDNDGLRRDARAFGALGDAVHEIHTTVRDRLGDHECLGGDEYAAMFLQCGHQGLLNTIDELLHGHVGALRDQEDRRLRMDANYRQAESAAQSAVGRSPAGSPRV